MKRLWLILLALNIAACSGAALVRAAEIPIVEWKALSDTDVSPEGRKALAIDLKKDRVWKHAETEHFVYHFWDGAEAETVYLGAELYYKWVKDFFGITEDTWKKKAHAFVFSDKKIWKDFIKDYPSTEGAEAFTTGWELFIYRNPYWLSPKKTLAHELTHLIVFRFLDGPLPLFLNEGIAELMGYKAIAMQADGDEYWFRAISRIPRQHFIPLEQLAAIDVYPRDNEEVFYRESELLARFVISEYQGKNYYTLLREVSKGKPFKEAVSSACGVDYKVFEEKFIRFATKEEGETD